MEDQGSGNRKDLVPALQLGKQDQDAVNDQDIALLASGRS